MEVKLFLSDILKKTDIDPKNIMLIRHVLSNDKCREYVEVETGVFGAFMKVDLLNNGPVTILLEKEYDD